MVDEALKKSLYNKCLELVGNRVSNAEEAMVSAQEAANEETKSSAGDKYNTNRSLMQLEWDKYANQLEEAQKLSKTMALIDASRINKEVELGSLVQTNTGIYFMSVSLGKVIINDKEVYAISMASPIGQRLKGQIENDEINFNGRKIRIEKIV